MQPGQALVVLSAMKMETSVGAPCQGVVQHVAVIKGDSIDAGEGLTRGAGLPRIWSAGLRCAAWPSSRGTPLRQVWD